MTIPYMRQISQRFMGLLVCEYTIQSQNLQLYVNCQMKETTIHYDK